MKGIAVVLGLLATGPIAGPVGAQELSGLARLVPEASRIEASDGGGAGADHQPAGALGGCG